MKKTLHGKRYLRTREKPNEIKKKNRSIKNVAFFIREIKKLITGKNKDV